MSYIRDYLIYSTNNEAPEMFHVYAGYSTLSSAIGRRVWLPRGENVMYPNIYVLLIGSAGSGKSTALRNAKRLLAQLDVPLSYSVETPEGLCRFMGGDAKKDPPVISPCCLPLPWPDGQLRDTHNITIVANEFIDFISKNQEGWTSMLNNIYDEDKYDYRTKNVGEDVLIGPYVVLLGAIPTETQKKLQRQEIIDTGFARRAILQYGERRTHDPHPDPIFGDEEKAARERCLKRLKEIQRLRGPMFRTPDGAKWWDTWYRKHSHSINRRATPSTLGWLMSKPDQVIKLAILNSLSLRDDLTITAEDFELGISFLDETEKTFNMVFGGIGRNELAAVAMQILNYMTNRDEPMSFKAMLGQFFSMFTSGKGQSELTEVLDFLCGTEQLVKKEMVWRTGAIGVTDTIYATPQGMQKYLAASLSPPNAAVRVEITGDFAPSTDPSSAPKTPLGLHLATKAHRAAAQSDDDTEASKSPAAE